MTKLELSNDLQEALIIGMQRLELMNELMLKCRSRMDFCAELFEVASDCKSELKYVIAKQGYELACTYFGPDADTTLKWKSRLENPDDC
jgi:hypothetical protein